MAEFARDEYLRVHGAHPDQAKEQASQGTTLKMPGGREGVKR